MMSKHYGCVFWKFPIGEDSYEYIVTDLPKYAFPMQTIKSFITFDGIMRWHTGISNMREIWSISTL